MATMYKFENRRVIPNWRDFRRTVQLNELRGIGSNKIDFHFNLSSIKNDWHEGQNIGVAADLINAAFVSNQFKSQELNEAIEFVKSNTTIASTSLIQLADLIQSGNGIKIEKSLLEIDVNTLEQFRAFVDNNTLHKLINRTKNISINEVRNPVIWVELARLYSMKGQDKKAENAINTALHLAPNNRFVLRSATRFFIHNKVADKALYYLRKSSSIKKDPWLIAAHISTSNVIGRFSPFTKDGISMINSGNHDPFDLTELSSSIGSQEYYEGTFKKAKFFLNKSLISPNDNSLAQIEWLSQDDSRLEVNPFNFKNVVNPFEAYAFDFYNSGNWNKALENSIKWFLDMPFSKRPILLSSFISGSLLKDYNSAIFLTKVGLQANPRDPGLLNNILFYSAMNDNLTESDKYIERIKDLDGTNISDNIGIVIQATLGLIALKRKYIDEGISLYEDAILDAQKSGNSYIEQLALLNLTKELITQKFKNIDKYVERVKSLKIDKNQLDLVYLKNDLFNLLNKQKML